MRCDASLVDFFENKFDIQIFFSYTFNVRMRDSPEKRQFFSKICRNFLKSLKNVFFCILI